MSYRIVLMGTMTLYNTVTL